jgi:predicted RNA-binding protein
MHIKGTLLQFHFISHNILILKSFVSRMYKWALIIIERFIKLDPSLKKIHLNHFYDKLK